MSNGGATIVGKRSFVPVKGDFLFVSLRKFAFYSLYVLLVVEMAHGQQSARNHDIEESVESCSAVTAAMTARAKMGIGRADSDHAALMQACNQLEKAIASSDPGEIQSAAINLRPILARLGMAPSTPQEQLEALEKRTADLGGKELFYELADLAKRAFNAGDTNKAEAYSKKLLQMAPQYPKNWNYGNAIYYGNFVLGRIAVQREDLVLAGQYLLAAGATPGSPQLDSFGPNLALAKDLLDKGESQVVLQFFALCKKFWAMDGGKLDKWGAIIRSGGIPDLTGNLYQ